MQTFKTMKTINRIALAVIAGASLVSCNNFLEVKSPSVVDGDFVFGSTETAKSVMLGAYNGYISHSNTGMMCNLDNIGSDLERCSAKIGAADLCGAANMWGGLPQWEVEQVAVTGKNLNPWGDMYNIIAKCNQVIGLVEGKSEFDKIVADAPNAWSDLLGQAYCLRATCYYDLIRWYGDVIYIDEPGKDIIDIASRYAIVDGELDHLRTVVDKKYMFSIGENNHFPDQMTRNYAEGLIGRLCFMQAGYQTRRTDGAYANGFYVDGKGNAISFTDEWKDEARNASYARPANYKDYYAIAAPYLKDAVENAAGAKLVTVDPRATDNLGRTYGNPFQYVFENFNDLIISEESVYEVAMKPVGGGSRVPYNYGRGAANNNPGFPPKANAQTCSYPENLYGLFDPADMRRDVSLSVTGSNGWGVETLYSFSVGNRLDVGIGMNKFDPNRTETDRYQAKQLESGINFPVMRQSDIILMYAEALAVGGNEAEAKTQLKKVHDRAFTSSTTAVKDAKFNELLASEPTLVDAIIKERALEFVGEGLRRWDLVRTGTFPKVSVEFRNKLNRAIEELKTNGYVEYENGNQFPAYIWTKLVDANKEYGYRLTMQCPEGEEEDPILYPSWRGQHDNWLTCAENYYGDKETAAKKITVDNTNLAIKGMFRYIDPESAEAKALEADGYKKTAWGAQLINGDASREAEWSTNFQAGYTDAMYAAKKAPIYLVFIKSDILTTINHTNGYGFKSK